jgi:hypothetical protein
MQMCFELISEGLKEARSEPLSPAELSIRALPIPLGDVGWLLWGLFQP